MRNSCISRLLKFSSEWHHKRKFFHKLCQNVKTSTLNVKYTLTNYRKCDSSETITLCLWMLYIQAYSFTELEWSDINEKKLVSFIYTGFKNIKKLTKSLPFAHQKIIIKFIYVWYNINQPFIRIDVSIADAIN